MKDRTLEILTKHLDGDYKVSPMAPYKSSLEDIKNVEKELDITFPSEYVAHLLGDDSTGLESRGICIEVKENIWKRPKLYDIGPAWSFLYGLHTYTACQESEDWMKLTFVGKDFIEDTGIQVVPILKIIGDADMYCIDKAGNVVRYNHKENIIEQTNMNFWEVYELKELKERKELILKGE